MPKDATLPTVTGRAVFITHRTKPGLRDEVQLVWQRHLQPAIQANPGHVDYHYCFDATDPDLIRVFRLYADAGAAAAFLTTAAYAAYLSDVEPLLLGPPEVAIAGQVWTKN